MKSFVACLLLGAFMVSVEGLKSAETCSICKYVFGALESQLENNQTETAIINELKTLCGEMPAAISTQCKQLVVEYGRNLIDSIDRLTPTQFCDLTHMCAPKSIAAPASGEGCLFCTSFLQFVRSKLSSKPTKAEIENLLQDVCKAVPAALSKECTKLVTTYGPAIIAMLAGEVKPKVICEKIHICKA